MGLHLIPNDMPKDTLKAYQVVVKGRVQGVGFRAFTRRNAMLLELKGEVKNLSDGSVKAHIEGTADRVKQMIHLLGVGPSLAMVDDIQVASVEPSGRYNTFEVAFRA